MFPTFRVFFTGWFIGSWTSDVKIIFEQPFSDFIDREAVDILLHFYFSVTHKEKQKSF